MVVYVKSSRMGTKSWGSVASALHSSLPATSDFPELLSPRPVLAFRTIDELFNLELIQSQ
jgi:hypothetical protein